MFWKNHRNLGSSIWWIPKGPQAKVNDNRGFTKSVPFLVGCHFQWQVNITQFITQGQAWYRDTRNWGLQESPRHFSSDLKFLVETGPTCRNPIKMAAVQTHRLHSSLQAWQIATTQSIPCILNGWWFDIIYRHFSSEVSRSRSWSDGKAVHNSFQFTIARRTCTPWQYPEWWSS